MKIVFMIMIALFVGLCIGFLLCTNIVKRQKKGGYALLTALDKVETMKKVIWVCLGNGFAWVWCSYVLAYMDKPQIAESLSQVAVTEIVGVVLAYAIKSTVENLSKNNRWPDNGNKTEEKVEEQNTPGIG